MKKDIFFHKTLNSHVWTDLCFSSTTVWHLKCINSGSRFSLDQEKKADTIYKTTTKLHPHAAVALSVPPVEWVSPAHPPNLSDRPVLSFFYCLLR